MEFLGRPVGEPIRGIRETWYANAPNYDQVLSMAGARRFLMGQHPDANPIPDGAIGSALTALNARRADAPEFFEQHDLEWAFDPDSYDFPAEAAQQVRLLDGAVALWRSDLLQRRPAPCLGGIVARSSFLTRFDEVTPFTFHAGGFHFVVTPLGWLDFIDLFFSGFAAYLRLDPAAPATEAWERVLRPAEDGGMREARRHWMEIVLNIAVSRGCSHDVLVPQALRAVRCGSAASRDMFPSEGDRNQSVIGRDLAYLAHEFALHHEVGHVLVGDTLHADRLPDEGTADLLALGAFVGSWGWRHERLDGSGLSDVGRIMAGSMAFVQAVLALAGARSLLAPMLNRVGSPEISRLVPIDALLARGQATAQRMDAYLSTLIGDGRWPDRRADERMVQPLLEHLGCYLARFCDFVREHDQDVLHHAYKVARAQRLEG